MLCYYISFFVYSLYLCYVMHNQLITYQRQKHYGLRNFPVFKNVRFRGKSVTISIFSNS